MGKWHGIVVSMMDCGPEDPGLIPHLAFVVLVREGLDGWYCGDG